MLTRAKLPALTAFALTLLTSGVVAQTVDAIVEKNLKARGGVEKLRSIEAMRLTGKLSAGGTEMPLTIVMKRPNLMRQEMSFQGESIIQAFDGERAWAINPMMGTSTPQEIRGPQGDMMRDQADFDGALLDYKQKGHTVELEGEDTVDGKKAVRLKVTKKSGQVQRIWFNAETGLELKTASEVVQGDQTITVETRLSNYQDVSGIKVPFTMETLVNGMPQASIVIEKVDTAPAVDAQFFKMPAPVK